MQLRHKTAFIVLGVILLCAVIISLLFSNWYLITAKVWHWQNGYSAQVGRYRIPVPEQWRVVMHDSNNLVLANNRYGTGLKGSGSIIVSTAALPPRSLSLWQAATEQALKRKNVEIEEQTIQIPNDTGVCIGGDWPKQMLDNKDITPIPNPTSSTSIAVDCAFTGSLSVRYLGRRSDLPEFYRIVSQITTAE
jgi:hypothetical protein